MQLSFLFFKPPPWFIFHHLCSSPVSYSFNEDSKIFKYCFLELWKCKFHRSWDSPISVFNLLARLPASIILLGWAGAFKGLLSQFHLYVLEWSMSREKRKDPQTQRAVQTAVLMVAFLKAGKKAARWERKGGMRLILEATQRNGYSYIPDENGTTERKIFKLKSIHIMQF